MAKKTKSAAKVVPLKIRKCPNCGKPAVPAHRPFCSDRCADADLGRWLNEEYRIPTNETPGDLTGEALGDDDGAPGGDR
jgi:endogenous inhibitor of DNA gyrase (YacG/DUF329 family)